MITDDLGITEDNVEAFSLYSLYGAWGMVYNAKFTSGSTNFKVEEVIDVLHKIFYRNM